jgi:hypothetical protein
VKFPSHSFYIPQCIFLNAHCGAKHAFIFLSPHVLPPPGLVAMHSPLQLAPDCLHFLLQLLV